MKERVETPASNPLADVSLYQAPAGGYRKSQFSTRVSSSNPAKLQVRPH
jgi:hypothetical protein